MSVDHSQVTAFVKSLRVAKTHSGDLVNIYDCEHDPHRWRCKRLERWLTLPREGRPLVLFVGEAPGRDGAAVTGVPFSSVATLRLPEFARLHPVCRDEQFASIVGGKVPERERTATAFWKRVLPALDCVPLPVTWNIVPFWPRKADGKNRTPRIAELRFGLSWTQKLIEMFEFDAVIAVGRSAERMLKEAGICNVYVRHPSYGGAVEFEEGVKGVMDEPRCRN